MNTQKLQTEIEHHAQVMSELMSQLRSHIISLPDNPQIKRYGNNPKCFTIRPKNIANNWSAEHHDFKKQYETVAAELSITEPDNVFKKLCKIIEEKKIKHKFQLINLHPDVINYLRKTANMPPENCPVCHGEREWDGKDIQIICHFCKK
jgi:hypothetical protein